MTDTTKKEIVLHAGLATHYARSKDPEQKSKLREELAEIETRLGMSPSEIAEQAINIYKQAY